MENWEKILLSFFIIFLSFFIYLIFRFFYLYFLNKNYRSFRKSVIFNQKNLIFSDGTELPMILNVSTQSDVFVIFNHGFGAHLHDLKWISDFITKKRYSILIYSRRNENKVLNDHKLHIKKNVDDCLDILEALHQKYPNKKFILIGHSLGAAITAECSKSKRTIPLNCSFVILNSPNDLNSLYPYHFLEKNLFSYFHLMFIFLFNKNLSPRIHHRFLSLLLECNAWCAKDTLYNFEIFVNHKKNTKKKVQEFLLLHHQKLRSFSFFYFWTMFLLFRDTFNNLKKNTWNNIYIFQGEFDYFATIKKIKQQQQLIKQKNIKFYYIKNFGHRFENNHQRNKIIIDDILKIVLQKKINLNLSSVNEI